MATTENADDLPLRLIVEDLKKMKPPNKKKYDDEMETLQSQIKEKEIRYDKLKSSVSEIKVKEAERKRIVESRRMNTTELEKLNKTLNEKMRRFDELKSSLVYKNEDKINSAISRLEWNMNAKTFKLTEEKKIVLEIDRLKRSKKTLVQYQDLDQEISVVRSRQRYLRSEIDKCSKKISDLKAKEDRLRQDGPQVKVCKQEIDNLYEQKQQLFASFKRQKEEFKDVKDKQRNESLKKKEEERRAIVEVKRKQRVEMEADKLPHEGEVHLCQTLVNYLSRFGLSMPDTWQEGLSPASSQDDPEPAEEIDDGQFVLLRKTDEIEDLDFSIGHNRRSKKSRRSRKQSMIKKITHSPDVLSQFMALSLNAPGTLLEVAEAIDELKKKKAFYEKEQMMVESASDAGFSLTESMQCEMSRQASKTESYEGGSQENTRPDEGVYTALLDSCKGGDSCLEASGEELLGAVGGVAADYECSDSATPKSDSLNSDSTVEGDGGSNGGHTFENVATTRSSDNDTVKEQGQPGKSVSPRSDVSKPAPWLSTSSESTSIPGTSQRYLAVPDPTISSHAASYPALPSHQPLQKTESVQPHCPVAKPEIKSYAHSVVGRSKSFSCANNSKQNYISSLDSGLSHQPSPPSSLLLSMPLSSSLNLPTKHPVRRSKTMTPTGSTPWTDLGGAWGSKGDNFKTTSKNLSSQSSEDHALVSPSVPRPLRSPLSPRHSFSPQSKPPSATQTTATTLDQDFPPLSQTASLRRSSNLSSQSSNGSQCCPDQSYDSIVWKPSPGSTPSSAKNTLLPPPSIALPQSQASPAQQDAHADLDKLSDVKEIPVKNKSDTERWVESSMAFVQDEAIEEVSLSLREATRL